MTDPEQTSNPFPGLRPFGADDEHLFFGREEVVDSLLARLRQTRFLSVIGSSGSGKSSLVRAGLIPSLHGGYMISAGSSWRVAVMRPGADPIGNLAAALNRTEVLGKATEEQGASPVLTEVTLRRSKLGLLECLRLARLPAEDNLLIVVDQFEELFRFRQRSESEDARDEAVAFVKRLLSVTTQCELPVYVVLTMRSDFIGDCIEYPGLAEAINEGQFLVPRMTRDQLRSAIRGPVLVAGGEIAPRLLARLLNDVGDDPDRLPVLQHALMRTWGYWQEHSAGDDPIDVRHYEAIGTIDHALSTHAEEAYDELTSDRARETIVKVLKTITDTTSDDRGIRRPTSVEQLCRIAETDVAGIAAAVDPFRQADRSFLMPPVGTRLEPDTVIDISHESLMRVWDRLDALTHDEARSARSYLRLAKAAVRYDEGTTGLWRDPELALALEWRDQAKPTRAWAEQHHPAFGQAMDFLDASEAERNRQLLAKRRARRKMLQTAWGVSVILLVFAIYAMVQQQRAEDEQQRAEQNYQLAVRAVDEMLTEVAGDESSDNLRLSDIPQTEELRQELLEKARMFFEALREDPSADPNLRLEAALAQVQLGRIYDLRGQRDMAMDAHAESIRQLGKLHNDYPEEALFQHRLGEAYNWLGEHFRPYDSRRAEVAYTDAAALQTDLVDQHPDVLNYRYELGRTNNNLGILLSQQSDRVSEAEDSFNTAIGLFGELRQKRDDPSDALRLARTRNNLAILFRENGRPVEAETAYVEAILQMEELLSAAPQKREYREGLARMLNNLGNLQLTRSKPAAALQSNSRAQLLFEDLATPVQGLRSEIANTLNTRGQILVSLGRTDEAEQSYRAALNQFEQLEQQSAETGGDPALQQRYGNALANLAILSAKQGRFEDAVAQVSRAIGNYKNAVNSPAPSADFERSLSNAYWLLADTQLKSGNYREGIIATESLIEITKDANAVYRAAVLYMRATDLMLTNRSLDDRERTANHAAYEGRAIALLRQALNDGYPFDQFQRDASDDFEHLYHQEDFQGLLRRP